MKDEVDATITELLDSEAVDTDLSPQERLEIWASLIADKIEDAADDVGLPICKVLALVKATLDQRSRNDLSEMGLT